MNYLKQTQETYRQIAADYALAWQKRGSMLAELEKFVSLLPAGATVLDVGCGPGKDTAVLQAHNLNAIGLDYSYEMMQVGRDEYGRTVPFCQADMRHLPIGPQVDGIWACASLLHLHRDDFLPTLQQFWRVLRPGGILYLSVKQGDGEKWVLTTKYGHDLPRFFTFWQPETLDLLLETAAFSILAGWAYQGEHDAWLDRFAQKLPMEVEP
ncbi:MAG: class I SAM-dependent methyltransferase [Ardenticatenaceae bacterium]|nr:class I SAM-dependent methyltransferase [Anaerolineales bacterium]MCB8937412.1 class I SAM-dependent methyltransferase [Ardenticatenaceae bacterium]MCB8975394.1 class I SAM-dependent methyltransferase [Ardenticatenaceae bacterium]